MKLSVPSRFETNLLEAIKMLNVRYGSIGKVYGSLPYSIIGHGRTSGLVMQFGEFGMDKVKEFAKQAHEIGINVNYLANSLCLGEMGYGKYGRDRIIKYLGDIYDSGADILTISSPYLLRLVKNEFPELKVEISVHAHVDTVQKFKRWEELGADIINLPAGSNRDFKLLDAISRSHKVDVELLVNEACLFNCPYALYHHTLSSHRSKHPDEELDYCMLECVMDRLENPAELLRAPWIRPEDIAYYEETFKIHKFKIQGRQMPVEWITRTVEAYCSRRYSGNLLDIISPTYPDWSTRSTSSRNLLHTHNAENFVKPDVYIDNTKLDKFFGEIIKKGGCSSTQQCYVCGHCDRVAKKEIQIRNKYQFRTYTSATKALFEELIKAA